MDLLPGAFQDRLSAMSPLNYLHNIQSSLIILLHDRGDTVIPVGESQRLWTRLSARAGVYYKELQFQHLNPAKLPVFRLVSELVKFYTALYPLFHYKTERSASRHLSVKKRCPKLNIILKIRKASLLVLHLDPRFHSW